MYSAIRNLVSAFLFFIINPIVQASFSYRAVIVDSLTEFPCSKSSDYAALMPVEPLFVEANIPISTLTLQELMFTMWIFPLGNPVADSTIFSLHTATPFSTIFTLNYSLMTQTLSATLKGALFFSETAISPNQWLFIKIIITLESSPNNDEAQVWMSNPLTSLEKTAAASLLSSPSGSATLFSRSNLLLNIGYSSDLIPEFPSCSRVRRMEGHLIVDALDKTSIPRFQDLQGFSPSLLVHYKFSQNINGKTAILSNGPYQDRLYNMPIHLATYIAVQQARVLTLTSVISSSDDGIFIYFTYYLQTPTNDNRQIISLNFPSFYVTLKIKKNNQIYLGTSATSDSYIMTGANGAYYGVVIGLSNQFGRYSGSIHFTYYSTFTSNQITFPASIPSGKVNISFGDYWTTQTLYIFDIVIFKGTQYTETPTCHFQLEAKNNSPICLQCKYPGTCTQYNGQLSSTGCPTDMMITTTDGFCKCRIQTYNLSNVCTKCPTFCRGCTGPNSCIEKDPNRNELTGKCNNNLFDDGYSCIERTFEIRNRKDFSFKFGSTPSSINLNASYFSLTGNPSNDTFFVTTQVNAFAEQPAAQFPQVILYIRNNGEDIFTITIEKQIIPQTYQICFYQVTTVLKCFGINQNMDTQIGLWASSSESILSVIANGSFEYETKALLSPPITFISPSLCAGICNAITIPVYQFSFNRNGCHFKFYKGMSKPTNGFMTDLRNAMQDTTKGLLHYLFKPNAGMAVTFNNLFAGTSSLGNSLLVVRNSLLIDRLKGLYFQQNVLLQINDIPTTRELSVSMNILIAQMTAEVEVMSYSMDGNKLTYSLIPMFSREHALIRVEYSNEAIETKSCVVNFNQPSFIAFIPRFMHTLNGSTKQILFEIEIVSDFCRETLKFAYPRSYSDTFKRNIRFYDSQTTRVIYLNNIRFFDGSDFYFDYTESDPCFLYYNSNDMACLKPKEGHVVFNGRIVDPIDCGTTQQNPMNEQLIVLNRLYSECQDSFVDNPKCLYISDDFMKCLKCRDPNADVNLRCECIDGYYYVESRNRCEKCHPKCARCSGSSEECLVCTFENTILPLCNCKESTQFQAADFSCQDCSPQCKTCEFNGDNCLQCEKDRVSEPTCECDPQYFSQKHSDNQTCIEIECSYKCESCEFSPENCTACAADREFTPSCECKQNSFEKDQICIKCPSSEYFDKKLKECLPCHPMCLECEDTATTCTECDSQLFLYRSQCLCSDLSHFLTGDNGEIMCSSGMQVSLSVALINSKTCLVYTFEKPLDPIDFNAKSTKITSLLQIYLYGVADSDFTIASTRIESNKLILELRFFKNLSVSGGQTLFLDNVVFKNAEHSRILSEGYLIDTLQFEFGPMVTKDDIYSPNDSLAQATGYLKEENSTLKLIKQLQVILYFINTLQPCSLFLLLRTDIPPPNLFQFFQVFGLLVFPTASDYGVPRNGEVVFEFFGETLELGGGDISENSSKIFRNLGLSGSMIVSMPIVFFQLLFWPALYAIAAIVRFCLLVKTPSVRFTSFVERIIAFAFERMFGCFEKSLLILIALSSNQFLNIHQNEFFNRISVYAAVLLNGIMCGLFAVNFKQLLRKATATTTKSKSKQEETIVVLNDFEKARFSLLEKYQISQPSPKLSTSVFYFYSQILKKVALVMILVFMDSFEQLACIFCASILFISFAISTYLRPYKYLISNICKIYGEAAQIVVWLSYLIVFIPFQKNLAAKSEMNDKETKTYLDIGFMCMIALLVFNILYFFEFILVGVVYAIKDVIEKRKQQKINEQLLVNNKDHNNSMSIADKQKFHGTTTTFLIS